MNTRERFFSKTKKTILCILCGIIIALSNGGLIATNAASTKIITMKGYGVSLNTNPNFRKINGQPRMSVSKSNPNDADQQFETITGNGGYFFKQKSTGKCLNANNPKNGTELNLWPCNSSDNNQTWDLLSKGNDYYLIRKKGTGLCVTADSPVANFSIVSLRDCIYGASSNTQDWIGSDSPHSPWYKAPVDVYTYKTVQVTPLYEYWIVARKIDSSTGLWNPAKFNEVGHAFTAIIRKNQKVIQTYKNGTLVSTSAPQDDGSWYRYHSYGFWPSGLRINSCASNTDGESDCANVTKHLSGITLSKAGQAIRKESISEARANYIHSQSNWAGCKDYANVFFVFAVGADKCNCVDYATRSWYLFAAQRSEEDFRPKFLDAKSPNTLVDNINERNRKSGSYFIDNGALWK